MSWKKISLSTIIEKPLSGEWGDGEGEINVLRTTNFTNDGTLDLGSVVKRNISSKKIEQKQLEFGDTIIEKSGGSPSQPVGRVVYFNQESEIFLCNNFTSVIRAKSAINKRFLFWFLFYNHLTKNTLQYQNKTTGIINLQLDRYINEIEIPLPPLPIQKRIAEILDAADALKRKDQQLLKKYDELAQAIFIDMFGDPAENNNKWVVRKFEDVVQFPSGLVDPKKLPFSNMFHVGGDNIESNTGRIFGLKKTSELSLKSGKFHFTSQHILYNKIRPYLNKVAMPKFEGVCSADMYPLLAKESEVQKDYLYFILKSKSFLAFADAQSRRANIPKINMTEMGLFEFPVPPIKKQLEFLEKIEKIKYCNDNITKLSQQSNSLFNSLIQKAFNGELVNIPEHAN